MYRFEFCEGGGHLAVAKHTVTDLVVRPDFDLLKVVEDVELCDVDGSIVGIAVEEVPVLNLSQSGDGLGSED